ncbi:MAG: 1-(5-phosphoribosyl)-5-[(5-phosphoribosylamino)methylideneamino]imidazole-4-carboxamide isomerase [Deltaproteobacteria bacterium]|nr:1-(5-phosphoribosyl)-5-[(5-phosphoribosylamino)methylideneamino]imidazole-4-carboxamide isomerase [Deltaproteobacteria bacterium]
MIVIPAIDLLGGKAVRLREGKREQVTVYHERPWEVAARFAREGAELIHVVDLDGAFAGGRCHSDIVSRIARDCGVPVQVGGGLREIPAIQAAIDAGARYVVLGTAAVKTPELVRQACATWPGQVVVAVDAKDGRVAVEGWEEISNLDAMDLAVQAAEWGAASILYTDVLRDGTRSGPNVAMTAKMQRLVGSVPVIASGGVSSLEDLTALAQSGVARCVVGRALYDGRFTLPEAVAVARGT